MRIFFDNSRYSTRVYIILLLTGLSILTIFTSLRMQTITVTITMPTLTNFTDLYDQYPLTLNCPCSQATVKYNQFIHYMRPSIIKYVQVNLCRLIGSTLNSSNLHQQRFL